MGSGKLVKFPANVGGKVMRYLEISTQLHLLFQFVSEFGIDPHVRERFLRLASHQPTNDGILNQGGVFGKHFLIDRLEGGFEAPRHVVFRARTPPRSRRITLRPRRAAPSSTCHSSPLLALNGLKHDREADVTQFVYALGQ
jgi:hypothetical protein